MTDFGKYELHEQLGRGGFGTVYRATDTSLGREVAIKILHPQLMVDETFVERFKKEARVLAALDHPNIVTIHEMGELDGRVFIAMKYLSGGSLQSRIQKEGVITFEDAKTIMGQVCEGLQVAHEQGMVHRDLKPANILFDQRGNAVISDFGLARVAQMSASSSSLGIVGTPAYRAPELWRGKPPATPATDVYSLGCIFVEMITGKVLFDGQTPDEIITQHLVDGPILTQEMESKVTPHIKELILSTLNKESSKRPMNAAVFHADLINSSIINSAGHEVEQIIEKPKPIQFVKDQFSASQTSESNLMKIELEPGVEMEFVRVPAGKFLMGSDPHIDLESRMNEQPQRSVYLNEYWIGKYPVTNEQFKTYLKTTNQKNSSDSNDLYWDLKSKHPVVAVNWQEAQEFCSWVQSKTGRMTRLPTEAEWEKASRGLDGNIYPWGNLSPDASFCNFNNNEIGSSEVGKYSPKGESPFGCADCAGNVWEWVEDFYGEYDPKSIQNPKGPVQGKTRVLKGGSYANEADHTRSAYRNYDNPLNFYRHVGFRCLMIT